MLSWTVFLRRRELDLDELAATGTRSGDREHVLYIPEYHRCLISRDSMLHVSKVSSVLDGVPVICQGMKTPFVALAAVVVTLALVACPSTTTPTAPTTPTFDASGVWYLKNSGTPITFLYDLNLSHSGFNLTGKAVSSLKNEWPIVNGYVSSLSFPKESSFTFEFRDASSPCTSVTSGLKTSFQYVITGSFDSTNTFTGSGKAWMCNAKGFFDEGSPFPVEMRR